MSDRIRSLLQDPAFNREWLERDLHRPPVSEPPYVPQTPEEEYRAMRMMHERHQRYNRDDGQSRDGHAGLVHREQAVRRDMPTGMKEHIGKYGPTYIKVAEPPLPTAGSRPSK